MNFIKKALTTAGGVFLAALLIAALAPKATHGLVAALVQIVPGTTTHVGQNESQLVSLACNEGSDFCVQVDPEGNSSSTAYVVPTGYTLVVTDFEWNASFGNPGYFLIDELVNSSTNHLLSNVSRTLADADGAGYNHEHYITGLRVGSGVTIADLQAAVSGGFANVQGYLVPND